MAAPKEIMDLVERFESNLESYKSGHYNETQVGQINVEDLEQMAVDTTRAEIYSVAKKVLEAIEDSV